MENKDRQKYLIIAVAVAAGLFLGNAIIYAPLKASWESRQAQIAKLKKDVEADKHLIRKQNDIMDRWDYIQNNALTNAAEAQTTILKAVTRWGQSSGVAIENQNPQAKSEQDDKSDTMINTIEDRVDATGTMTSLLTFLYAIEGDKLGLKLDNVEIASKDAYGQQLTLGLTISALVLDRSLPVTQAQPQTKTDAP